MSNNDITIKMVAEADLVVLEHRGRDVGQYWQSDHKLWYLALFCYGEAPAGGCGPSSNYYGGQMTPFVIVRCFKTEKQIAKYLNIKAGETAGSLPDGLEFRHMQVGGRIIATWVHLDMDDGRVEADWYAEVLETEEFGYHQVELEDECGLEPGSPQSYFDWSLKKEIEGARQTWQRAGFAVRGCQWLKESLWGPQPQQPR